MQNGSFPLVSVAIITYNQKQFLSECIESVLRQDYPNFEIIVADDASTDGTRDMLREYDSKYPGKFVFRLAKQNMGITANSNAANFACNGKYIAWMGGDDLMLPGKLRLQAIHMEKTSSCSICYHDLDVFDSDSNKTLYRLSDRQKPRQGDIRVAIKHGAFNGACSTMVRADKVPRSGFNKLLPVASDWLYWVEVLSNGGTIDYIDDLLGRYRRHSKNVTIRQSKISQNTIDHLNSCSFIMSAHPEYLKEITYRYAINLRGQRRNLPYLRSLWFCFKVTFDIKSILSVILYVVTFGLLKG